MAKRSRELPQLKYVSKDKYGYRYKPYMGRVDGKTVWGQSVWLCEADASPAALWKAYRAALGIVGNYLKEEVLEDALKYDYRKAWEDNSGAMYKSAYLNGWMDEACAHMERSTTASENNVVYIWEHLDADAEGRVYKIGVTSERRGEARIRDCARHNNMQAGIVMMLSCDDAKRVEKKLLKLGRDAGYADELDGSTEYRILSDEELGKAVKAAYKMAA